MDLNYFKIMELFLFECYEDDFKMNHYKGIVILNRMINRIAVVDVNCPSG